MRVLSFDLSLTRTGVVFAEIDEDKKIKKMSSVSIIPTVNENKVIKGLGFLSSKHQVSTKRGGSHWSYVKNTHETPTYPEKKKRDVAVRNAINIKKRESLAQQIKLLFDKVQPELILVERNESFNGILTTKLLAEARGILEGACVGADIKQYSVSEIRKGIDLISITKDFINSIADTGKPFPKDITKSALKYYVEKKYKITLSNTDESDACMVIDCYLREKEE